MNAFMVSRSAVSNFRRRTAASTSILSSQSNLAGGDLRWWFTAITATVAAILLSWLSETRAPVTEVASIRQDDRME